MHAAFTAPEIVLVVGNTSTPDALADVTAFAADVADRLGLPAVVAVGRDHRPEDFEGVVLADGWEKSWDSAALGAEAMLADVYCVWASDVYEHPVTTECGHCGTVDVEAAPVYADGVWTVSVCPPCADAARLLTVPSASLAVSA